jgi:arsenate reductase (thioredoxin)
MLVLGLQGSPRKKGNTNFLLNQFLEEARKLGAKTHVVDVCEKHIEPCKEYIVCEKKGYCPIHDDMETEIYQLLRKADVVVPATPIFFYNTTAQLKALIDRSQTLWARKYRLNLTDPRRKWRKGFYLAVGATKGKNLFEGVDLTMKYFFDAVGADFQGSLTYRHVEKPGDMKDHPTVLEDVRASVHTLIGPLAGRKRILFACRENACRSQMAAAFAQKLGGNRFDVACAGSTPVENINPLMVEVMQEIGVDMGFRGTTALSTAIEELSPEIIVTMGCGEECPFVPGCRIINWDLPDPAGQSIDFMRKVRDRIQNNVNELISEATSS